MLSVRLGRLIFRGDAQGVLQRVVFRRAKLPQRNPIVSEIALTLGGTMHDVLGSHW